jgi:hypothetical protein
LHAHNSSWSSFSRQSSILIRRASPPSHSAPPPPPTACGGADMDGARYLSSNAPHRMSGACRGRSRLRPIGAKHDSRHRSLVDPGSGRVILPHAGPSSLGSKRCSREWPAHRHPAETLRRYSHCSLKQLLALRTMSRDITEWGERGHDARTTQKPPSRRRRQG